MFILFSSKPIIIFVFQFNSEQLESVEVSPNCSSIDAIRQEVENNLKNGELITNKRVLILPAVINLNLPFVTAVPNAYALREERNSARRNTEANVINKNVIMN